MSESIDRRRRARILEQSRLRKMARSAHAYVRGNTALFYTWLTESAVRIPPGPPVWICGDCHLGNLGPLADAHGNVDIQIRDLDQTVIGNPAHDLIRLGLSLASAARGSDLPGVTTAMMLEQMVEGYGAALLDPSAGAAERSEPDLVRTVRRRALGRKWKHLARERIEDVRPVIPLGRRFWALSSREREALEALFADPDIKAQVLAIHGRSVRNAGVELVDAAYWMKGCSSLGKLRYAALMEIDEDGERTFALADLKEAVASVAPLAPQARMPRDHAKRVAAGARALSPNLGERMVAARVLDRPVIVRELAPQDLKLEVDQFTRREAVRAARYLAHVVGRAHARQMAEDDRAAWNAELLRNHKGALDAPHWLWEAVVALAASHERGYLEHCRQYALERAA